MVAPLQVAHLDWRANFSPDFLSKDLFFSSKISCQVYCVSRVTLQLQSLHYYKFIADLFDFDKFDQFSLICVTHIIIPYLSELLSGWACLPFRVRCINEPSCIIKIKRGFSREDLFLKSGRVVRGKLQIRLQQLPTRSVSHLWGTSVIEEGICIS